ncbi:MAG: MFS transporter [Deltaproteobacteria bacterium]|nr:MFS transporter [Deltaproteobacteria bacterium]
MNNNSVDPGIGARLSSPRVVFSLLFLLYMFDYIDRLVVVSLFPFLKQDWGISDTQCGLLVSAVYWSILIFTLPVSVLIDRWSRKKSIGLMALLWSAATLACAFTQNFTQLFSARTAIGLGEAGYAPGGTALIAAMFPKAMRARVLGVWNASIPLGSAMGIILGGIIAEHVGWRHAFGIVALPGVIVAVLFFFVRDYRTIALVKPGGSPGHASIRMGWGDIAGHFLKNRTLAFNNLAFAANTFVTTALMTWLPSYFQRMEDLSMSRAATKGGVVMMLAIVGAPLGGYLTDRWMKRRQNARLLFPAISSTTTAVILLAAFNWFAGPVQYALLMGAGISAVAFVPAAAAVTQDVVHPGLRAVSLSLCVIVQHILGSALGPPVIGALSDRFGLATAMAFLPLAALLAGILFFIGSFFHARDSQRAEEIQSLFSSTS